MKRSLIVMTVLLVVAAAGPALGAVTFDSVARTVTTSRLELQFSATNPEEISSLRWNGSPNLTLTGQTDCGDPLEYFGNSWSNPDSGDFVSIVGWGQSGTWRARGSAIKIRSVSESASDCYGAADLRVKTRYKFWDRGRKANRIMVIRKIRFGSTAFTEDFRPYIPRLYPLDEYTDVLYPDAAGTDLLTTASGDCELGCQISDWDDSWFAIHNPDTGSGLIVRQTPGRYDTDLWVDQDGASFTNSTSVLLLQPEGGFTGNVRTKTYLCFYDSDTWTPSLTLPRGC